MNAQKSIKAHRIVPDANYRKRVYPGGGAAWEIRYRSGSNCNRKTFTKGGFKTKEHARRYFREEILPALEAGFDTVGEYHEAERNLQELERWKDVRVEEFFDYYINQSEHWSPSTKQDRILSLNQAKRIIGAKRKMSSLSQKDILVFIGQKTSKGEASADTKLHRLRIIKPVLKLAVRMGILTLNPADEIRPPRSKQGKDVYLRKEQCETLFHACEKYRSRHSGEMNSVSLKALIAIALYTGMRKSEILHLEWQDIDFESGVIQITPKREFSHLTKSGKSRAVKVNSRLFLYLQNMKEDRKKRLSEVIERKCDLESGKKLEAIKSISSYEKYPSRDKLLQNVNGLILLLQTQIDSRLVFPSFEDKPLNSLPKGFYFALEQSGLKSLGVTFHSLRHTYASLLLQNCVPLTTVQKLLGHSSIKTTMRYSHLAEKDVIKSGQEIPDFESQYENGIIGHDVQIIDIAAT